MSESIVKEKNAVHNKRRTDFEVSEICSRRPVLVGANASNAREADRDAVGGVHLRL